MRLKMSRNTKELQLQIDFSSAISRSLLLLYRINRNRPVLNSVFFVHIDWIVRSIDARWELHVV